MVNEFESSVVCADPWLQEAAEIAQCIRDGGEVTPEMRQTFITEAYWMLAHYLGISVSPGEDFIYDSPQEHYSGTGPPPSMLNELVLYYTQIGYTDFIRITAGDEESLEVTINAPKVHRITMGTSPMLSLNDLKEQLSSFAAKEACVVIPALPVVSTFQFPWEELNEHAQSLGFATILDFRGALGRISMKEVHKYPSVILCDTPVVVSGQQSVCHYVHTGNEDLQGYLRRNHLLRLNGAVRHMVVDEESSMRDPRESALYTGFNLSNATISALAEVLRKYVSQRSTARTNATSVVNDDIERAAELSNCLQSSLNVPEFKLMADEGERADQFTLYCPYQPLQRFGRYGKLAFTKYLRAELPGVNVNIIDGTILLSFVAAHDCTVFDNPSCVKDVIDKWVNSRVMRRAVAEKLLTYRCIQHAHEVLTSLRERGFN